MHICISEAATYPVWAQTWLWRGYGSYTCTYPVWALTWLWRGRVSLWQLHMHLPCVGPDLVVEGQEGDG